MTRFFFNDTATTEIYTLSLHDALPIYAPDGTLEQWFKATREATLSLKMSAQMVVGILNGLEHLHRRGDRKSTRLNSSHANISYAVFCLKKNNCHYYVAGSYFCTPPGLV